MIVTCEQCTTQFQLDDARVPAGGVRVRCSRCKHAFFIEPPGAAAELDPHDRVAQDALDAEAPPEPGPSEDLAPSGLRDTGEFEDENDVTGESDWEFNQAPLGGGRADASREPQDAAGAVIDDLLGSRSERSPRQPAAPRERASAAPRTIADAEQEDLGSPESWDFLADDSPAGGASDADEDAPLAAAPSLREPARASLGSAAAQPVAEWIPPSRPSLVLSLLSGTGHTVGWSVTAALLVLIGVATLAPGLSPQAQPAPGSQRLASLQADGISGRWVENAVAGPLFVVSGRLENPTSEAVPLGALSGVRLLDANGARLAGEPASLGPVIPERELREADPAALQARQSEAGAQLAETPLRPGESVAFEAVVIGVPAAAARFLIEPLPQGHAAPAVETH